MIALKDTEFIKVITGVRRSGKSTLLLMYRDYLLHNEVREENIIYKNFESAMYDEIKNYKDLYKYVKNTIKKDIIDRNNIKDPALLENIIKYLANNIGSQVSATKISNYLNSNKIVLKCNHQTIDNYLNMLEKSYIMYKVDQTDIKDKSILKTLGKYYISVTGIRNIILEFRNINKGHLLKKAVYLELLRRGFKVSIGKTNEYEVDFVAESPHKIIYFQVSLSIKDEKVKSRELRSLENIKDNYEKNNFNYG